MLHLTTHDLVAPTIRKSVSYVQNKNETDKPVYALENNTHLESKAKDKPLQSKDDTGRQRIGNDAGKFWKDRKPYIPTAKIFDTEHVQQWYTDTIPTYDDDRRSQMPYNQTTHFNKVLLSAGANEGNFY